MAAALRTAGCSARRGSHTSWLPDSDTPQHPDTPQPSVAYRGLVDGKYTVSGELMASASAEEIFSILTDYDASGRIFENISSSQVTQQGGKLVLIQVGAGAGAGPAPTHPPTPHPPRPGPGLLPGPRNHSMCRRAAPAAEPAEQALLPRQRLQGGGSPSPRPHPTPPTPAPPARRAAGGSSCYLAASLRSTLWCTSSART
jgi:hypothetical protein